MADVTNNLRQGVVQTTALTPQMQNSLRILQTSALELGAELRAQLAANPLIEAVNDRRETTLSNVAPEAVTPKSAADSDVELDFTPDSAAAANILGANDGNLDYFFENNLESEPGYDVGLDRAKVDEHRQYFFDSQRATETLQEHLLAQVPTADFASEKDRELAALIIANITDTGRFDGSYPDMCMTAQTTKDELERVRQHVLAFDPAGCAWREPRECLLAQMDQLEDSPWEDEVRTLIENYLPDVAQKRTDFLCARLNLTPADLDKVLAALRTLNPTPGLDRRFTPASAHPEYVHPEIHAVYKDGVWQAVVDNRDIPIVRVAPRYLALLEKPDTKPEIKAYIREHLEAYQAIQFALEHRQDTIRAIAQAIIDAQPDFFARGLSALRPLTQTAIARTVGVDDSTVSRTVRNKYMTTPFGTFELSRFFITAFTTADGVTVTNTAIKERLLALVNAEDKNHPLSDEALATALKAEGLTVARRTVAKYRLALNIPGTAERRIKE